RAFRTLSCHLGNGKEGLLKRSTPWLLGAGGLLLAAGWVLGMGEDATKATRRRAKLDRVEFPRYQRKREYERMQQRRTLPPLAAPSPDPVPPADPTPAPRSPEPGRDPL